MGHNGKVSPEARPQRCCAKGSYNGCKNEVMATARASFLDEVKTRAASLGMSLADLVGLGSGKAAGKKAYVAGSGSPAKYRNPETGETWSGRGRPARWITELEAKGRKRDEFAI